MTNLNRLRVSLTKHGAHKIAWLLHEFDKDQVLDNLEGSVRGINIERAQATTNLSVAPNGVVPSVWNEAKELGNEAVNGLVLVSIILSHYRLIQTMIDSSSDEIYKGTIQRGKHLPGKEYTNFAHTLDELGFATSHTQSVVAYDLSGLFSVDGLNELAQKILQIKLDAAGWDRGNPLIDECIRLGLHQVFSLPEQEFRNWLLNGDLADSDIPEERLEDENFFTDETAEDEGKDFSFSPGHNPKKEGTVPVSQSKKKSSSRLLHNEIQNNLYEFLLKQSGESNVSTENDTGSGTSVDVVLRTDEGFTFFEIKTAKTVKQCIRQALPQLMEYAYWPDKNKANRLVVVSHLPTSPVSERYLETLRGRFGIPIYYEQFSLTQMRLVTA